MAGLYLHIPFCKQACYYCDFHFSTRADTKRELISTICTEIEIQKKYLESEPIHTIYFGGGTPSLLSQKEIEDLFNSIHKNFVVDQDAEITLEANPDDLTPENLSMFKNASINRLSIGIQSFDETVLKFLNRAHSAAEAERCIWTARDLGFNNISMDLIFSIPGQTNPMLKTNIDKAVALNPEHISAYSLTIEEKTVFGKWLKNGTLKADTDETAALQMEMVMDSLCKEGYEHYEVSNFCKPGFHSRHNSSYWQQKKYLGVGPSAHSYNGISRQSNISNNPQYVKSIQQGQIPFQFELLSRANKVNEYLLTTLRTSSGCDLSYLRSEFQFDLTIEHKVEIENYLHQGMLLHKENHIVLTPKGKLFADKISADLFTDDPT
ncbi:MAG: radical SAM family heme chaperone HemW [Bacteroidetes bacterium]|nr:radical SAM family heme chaperone HemW [Bacteroidota bacterium]